MKKAGRFQPLDLFAFKHILHLIEEATFMALDRFAARFSQLLEEILLTIC